MLVKVVSIVEIRMYVVQTVRVEQQPFVSFAPPAMRTVQILYWKSVRQGSGFLMSVMVVKLWVNVSLLKRMAFRFQKLRFVYKYSVVSYKSCISLYKEASRFTIE